MDSHSLTLLLCDNQRCNNGGAPRGWVGSAFPKLPRTKPGGASQCVPLSAQTSLHLLLLCWQTLLLPTERAQYGLQPLKSCDTVFSHQMETRKQQVDGDWKRFDAAVRERPDSIQPQRSARSSCASLTRIHCRQITSLPSLLWNSWANQLFLLSMINYKWKNLNISDSLI